jgi:uncharacterized tellurite resistance protein B-like protein
MFDTLKALLRGSADQPDQQAPVELAVAALLFEMARMEAEPTEARLASAHAALVRIFAMSEARAGEMLAAAGAPDKRLTSYFDAVSLLNRHFSLERKIALVEQLWRVAYSDSELDLNEDHLARKLSDLLYVPHVQCMLARQQARRSNV